MRPHPRATGVLCAGFGAARMYFGSLEDPALADWTSLAPLPRDLDERPRSAAPERFLERRAVARHLAAQLLGVATEAVAIGHDARGAPLILRPDGAALRISLAARDAAFAIALSPDPVGIDIERAAFDPRDIPWNVLDQAEQAMLRRQPASGLAPAFLQLWTAKEAVLKMLGDGLRRAPEEICIVPGPDGVFSIAEAGKDWRGVRGYGGSIDCAGQAFAWSVVSMSR